MFFHIQPVVDEGVDGGARVMPGASVWYWAARLSRSPIFTHGGPDFKAKSRDSIKMLRNRRTGARPSMENLERSMSSCLGYCL